MPSTDQRATHRRWYIQDANQSERQVYALLDGDRKPHYVGLSVNAETRTLTHWKQRHRRRTAVASWLRTLDAPPECWLIQAVPAEQGRDAEIYWINLLAQVPGIDLLNIHRGRRAQPLGTGTRGTANGNARLTEDDVRAIRASTEKQQVLADRYRITQASVSLIRARKKWTHVE